jgi:DNA-binding response OmpR family regulator
VLRRNRWGGREEARFGDLYINYRAREVRWRDRALVLTPTEWRLLEVLSTHPGQVFTRLQLIERIYGYSYEGLERTIDAHVKNLRQKIEPDPKEPRYVLTVYGVGYKFARQPDGG